MDRSWSPSGTSSVRIAMPQLAWLTPHMAMSRTFPTTLCPSYSRSWISFHVILPYFARVQQPVWTEVLLAVGNWRITVKQECNSFRVAGGGLSRLLSIFNLLLTDYMVRIRKSYCGPIKITPLISWFLDISLASLCFLRHSKKFSFSIFVKATYF